MVFKLSRKANVLQFCADLSKKRGELKKKGISSWTDYLQIKPACTCLKSITETLEQRVKSMLYVKSNTICEFPRMKKLSWTSSERLMYF